MAGLSITIELGGDLKDGLARLRAAGTDLTPAMQDIAVYLAASTRRRFESETGPDGKRWSPSRRVREEGGQTLTLSGDLRGSIRPAWGPDFAAAGPERSGGAGVYAAIHQFGGAIRPKNKRALSFGGRVVAAVRMPARPYLGFSDADRTEIVARLRDHLAAAIVGQLARGSAQGAGA